MFFIVLGVALAVIIAHIYLLGDIRNSIRAQLPIRGGKWTTFWILTIVASFVWGAISFVILLILELTLHPPSY